MDIWKSVGGVDKKLLPVKFHYFLFSTALSCALPFRTVFAKQLGISATAVGVIFCAIPFLKIVTNPLCGFILDHFKRFRLTISVIIILVSFIQVAMTLIPPNTVMHNSTNITTDFHSKFQYSCIQDTRSISESLFIYSDYDELVNTSKSNSFTCKMECSDSTSNFSDGSEKNMHQFTGCLKFEFTAVMKISSCDMDFNLTRGKMFSICDDVIYPVIHNVNQNSVYPKLWNSVSDKNCSKDNRKSPKMFNVSLSDNKIDENFDRNVDKINIAVGFIDAESYLSNVKPLEVDSKYKKRYFTLHKYKVKSENEDWHKNCPCEFKMDCLTKQCYPDFHKDKTILLKEEVTATPIKLYENEFLSVQFWSLFLLIALSNLSTSAIVFMMDTVCYELLHDRKDKYGQQKLWGTVGWGLGVFAGGYFNQVFSPNSTEINYTPSFYLLSIIVLIDLIPVYQLKVIDLKFSSNIWNDVYFLLRKSDILCNSIIVFSIGVLSGLIWNYQFWFMEEIGASQVLLGLSQMFESIFELPWFVVSGWIISKIGHGNCNSITFLFFGLRYLCFAFMYDPWMTLPVAILHGPTFGLFYPSLTMYAREKAPLGTEATIQSLMQLCFEGIGVATGIILGGVGMDHLGSHMTFMYAAEISFLLLFANVLMNVMFSRSEKKDVSYSILTTEMDSY